MALADELAALKDSKPRTFEEWLRTATEDDKQVALKAIRDVSIRANALCLVLRKNGIPITANRIELIRAGGGHIDAAN